MPWLLTMDLLLRGLAERKQAGDLCWLDMDDRRGRWVAAVVGSS